MANITITGDLGSGKSSVAKKLSTLLSFEHISTGKIQRAIGKEKGMNTLELNYFSEHNDEVDNFIDSKLVEMNELQTSHIFDSRMAWHFIKKSFKIYLTVSPLIAAKRVMHDSFRENEPIVDSIEKKAHNLIERKTIEDRRFKLKYGVECSNLENFDLIVDTSKASVEEVSQAIYALYKNWLNKEVIERYWVSPLTLIPTEHIRNLGPFESKSIKGTNEHNSYSGSIVKVVEKDYFWYVWDGAKHVSSAIFNEVPLVPISVIAKDNEEIHPGHTVSTFVQAALNKSWIYDWEDVHNFRFDFYPEEIITL